MDMINYLLFFCRHVVSIQQRKFLPAEDIQLSKFLLSVIADSQSAILPLSNSIIRHGCTAEVVKSVPKCNSLWDVQAVAFDLLSQAITSLGSYFPVDVWKSTIQVETILLHLWFFMNAFVGYSGVTFNWNVLEAIYSRLANKEIVHYYFYLDEK